MLENSNKKEGLEIVRLSNQSWFKLKYKGKVIHLDPGYLDGCENEYDKSYKEKLKKDKNTFNELEEKADLILVTHGHLDHVRDEVLDKIVSKNSVIIAPISCKDIIKYDKVLVEAGDILNIQGIQIMAVHSYNTESGSSTKKTHKKGEGLGYVFKIANKWCYIAGDTDLIDEMHNLGNIDIAFLPTGGIYVMDTFEAVKASEIIKPNILIPMHQFSNDLNFFKDEIISKGLPFNVEVLEIGDSLKV